MPDAPTPVLHFLGLPVMVSESYPTCSISRYTIRNTDGRHDRWIVGTDTYRDLAQSAGRGGKAVEWVEQRGEQGVGEPIKGGGL